MLTTFYCFFLSYFCIIPLENKNTNLVQCCCWHSFICLFIYFFCFKSLFNCVLTSVDSQRPLVWRMSLNSFLMLWCLTQNLLEELLVNYFRGCHLKWYGMFLHISVLNNMPLYHCSTVFVFLPLFLFFSNTQITMKLLKTRLIWRPLLKGYRYTEVIISIRYTGGVTRS